MGRRRHCAPEVRLSVVEDGRGAQLYEGAGHGLGGMRERAALYGGELLAGAAAPRWVVGLDHHGAWARKSCLACTGVSPSVVLADHQPLLRRGFRMILGAESGIGVISEAADGEEAVELAHRLRPDVVLMDIRMPAAGRANRFTSQPSRWAAERAE